MKSDSSAMPNDGSPAGPMPSEGVRTVLSLLLIVHMFCLFVAISSNFFPVSAMRAQLREVPLVRPYLRFLEMDLAYNYHLTYAEPVDFDHQLQIDLDAGDEPLVLPAAGLQPGTRKQRYYNLTRAMAINLRDEANEGVVPRAVAAGLLAQRDVDSGVHRLRLQFSQPPELPDSREGESPSEIGEVTNRTDYDANLIFLSGELGLVKRAPAAEVAPVVSDP